MTQKTNEILDKVIYLLDDAKDSAKLKETKAKIEKAREIICDIYDY